jgi:hypothetical protein
MGRGTFPIPLFFLTRRKKERMFCILDGRTGNEGEIHYCQGLFNLSPGRCFIDARISPKIQSSITAYIVGKNDYAVTVEGWSENDSKQFSLWLKENGIPPAEIAKTLSFIVPDMHEKYESTMCVFYGMSGEAQDGTYCRGVFCVGSSWECQINSVINPDPRLYSDISATIRGHMYSATVKGWSAKDTEQFSSWLKEVEIPQVEIGRMFKKILPFQLTPDTAEGATSSPKPSKMTGLR